MGNKMCKKKIDNVDNSSCKSPTPFDRIINRLHLRPHTWKSDSQLSEKKIKRSSVTPSSDTKQRNIINIQPLSKSSDWTEVDLEVPDKDEIDHVHLPNPKLSLIFSSSENVTPTPPPRKHKKNFREKLESVAKQAFQTNKKPVEEQLCVKKKIDYRCPLCDKDEMNHNRNHHHHHGDNKKTIENGNVKTDGSKGSLRMRAKTGNESKRKKNLSVISLPNYDELKFTVGQLDDKQKATDPFTANMNKKNSLTSTQTESKKPLTGSTGKLDKYITRCRSFGSLFPQQFKQLKVRKAPADIESDDSFGPLEDWDLGLIEHYDPKDASLPRQRKDERSNQEVISDLESLIVQEEDIQEVPKPPIRRSESLVRKISREGSQSAQNLRTNVRDSKNPTPPPSPNPKPVENNIFPVNLPTEVDGKVEHSSLMKILEEFSIKDKQKQIIEENSSEIENTNKTETVTFNNNSLSNELSKKRTINSILDFIDAERVNTDNDLNYRNTNGSLLT